MHLSSLLIYPVKSLAGIALQEAVVERRGLQYDRRWMVTDPDGQFVTQREVPAMALIGTAIEAPWLVLFDRNNPSDQVRVPLDTEAVLSAKMRVSVWSSRLSALPVSNDADLWLSQKLGRSVRLVGMPDRSRRAADGRYAPKGQYVSFADGFPFLIIGEASLADLNARLESPVPMDRFRPNLVFSGGTAFEEDTWSDFRIGTQLFRGVKPCARCVMTTINQDNAQKNSEPLRTLSSYRRNGNKVLFGQNVIWLGEGPEPIIRVGDAIVLSPPPQ